MISHLQTKFSQTLSHCSTLIRITTNQTTKILKWKQNEKEGMNKNEKEIE